MTWHATISISSFERRFGKHVGYRRLETGSLLDFLDSRIVSSHYPAVLIIFLSMLPPLPLIIVCSWLLMMIYYIFVDQMSSVVVPKTKW